MSIGIDKKYRVNERIREREIRGIDADGGQLGVMQPFEAMKKARESGLDLVEISPTAVPPVCKIMDFGKFRYEENKREHEQRKHHRGGHIKEVKFRPSTAEHDYQVRKNRIVSFLTDGYKVKAMIFHRGREMAHPEVGRRQMTRLLAEKEIQALGQVEATPRMEANILLAVLAPKKGAAPAVRPPQAGGAAETGGANA